MSISKAKEIADALNGEVRERDDGTWLVLIARADGRVVAVLDNSIEEYADLDDLTAGRCYACISLA